MCSGSENKSGHVMIWIIKTWIKQHYKANRSEATPELPHELLNLGFGSGGGLEPGWGAAQHSH